LKIFDKHNALDSQITKAEIGATNLTDIELEILKKEKLLLKDESYSLIMLTKKNTIFKFSFAKLCIRT